VHYSIISSLFCGFHGSTLVDVEVLPENPEIAQSGVEVGLVTDRRDQELVRQGVISRQAADNQHALMLQAKAAYQQLIAMQAYEVIVAPVSGLITARYADPGTLIPQATAG
jgi:multidrug efflux pump subunit AcrA (membrane-fusion protein)